MTSENKSDQGSNVERTLEGQVIVVTGASRGIGYFTALQLAERGAHVIAVARTVGGLEDLDDAIKAKGGSATLVPMDLKDFEAIDRLGGAIYERWGKLDGLVANGGILGILSPLGHIKPSEWEKVMAINVTANFRLIRSLDPLLRQADAARVLLLSSGAAWKCKPYWGVYSVSKAAVEALAKTYAGETRQTSMCVNAINPGATRTAMRAKAMPGEDPDTLPTPAEIAEKIVATMLPGYSQTGKLIDIQEDAIFDLIPGYGQT
ncbi:MAG: SDR family NAD(P)-dependent oxidoreductase [Alphaproteobacteria bacterium]|nr:SDR family NAD(P)-dependent oxidoreductase [Alphaproteobacteria bacterium]